jgi:hypothetical protein
LKKEAKLLPLGYRARQAPNAFKTNVFWFFFSKKNRFLP